MERWLIDMKDMHDLEVYACIDGFPNYLVASHGRVLSLKGNKIRELKPRKGKDGYMRVVLCKNGKRYDKLVHRLVAQAFIPNPENKPEVNHINEIKTDNRAENLEWMTCKENINYGSCIKRRTYKYSLIMTDGRMKGSKNPRSKSVIGFKINGCDIKYYKYINECKKDGFTPQSISSCCKGKHKSYKDYVWYYADDFFNRKD